MLGRIGWRHQSGSAAVVRWKVCVLMRRVKSIMRDRPEVARWYRSADRQFLAAVADADPVDVARYLIRLADRSPHPARPITSSDIDGWLNRHGLSRSDLAESAAPDDGIDPLDLLSDVRRGAPAASPAEIKIAASGGLSLGSVLRGAAGVAAAEVARRTGVGLAPLPVIAARRRVCVGDPGDGIAACPRAARHPDRPDRYVSCGACGCLLRAKTIGLGSACPDGRWS